MALDVGSQWKCRSCTFDNSPYLTECEMCGTSRNPKPSSSQKSKSNSNTTVAKSHDLQSKPYGRVIYQVDRITKRQLAQAYKIYSAVSSSSKPYPIFLFGDNNIDNERHPSLEREHFGGLANVCGDFDRDVCYGVVTTWYGFQSKPNLEYFKQKINKHFVEISEQYLSRGHDVIVPCPNDEDLIKHSKSYYEFDFSRNNKRQVIFHNLGTGIAGLPLKYLKYIQFRIDELEALANKHAPFTDEDGDFEMKINGVSPDIRIVEEKSEMKFRAGDKVEVLDPRTKKWLKAIAWGMDAGMYFVEIKSENRFENVSPKDVREESVDEEKKMELSDEKKDE